MKQKFIFLQTLLIASLLLFVTDGPILLPTEKTSDAGVEQLRHDDQGNSPEVQKIATLEISQSVSAQEHFSPGLPHLQVDEGFWEERVGTFAFGFFYRFSDKRELILRYLHPFHTFW